MIVLVKFEMYFRRYILTAEIHLVKNEYDIYFCNNEIMSFLFLCSRSNVSVYGKIVETMIYSRVNESIHTLTI